jgi:hypothetical protein
MLDASRDHCMMSQKAQDLSKIASIIVQINFTGE